MIRLESVLKTSLQDVLKTSSKRLESVLKMPWRRLEDVLKTPWKMSWRCFCKTSWRCASLQDVLKTSWKRLEDVLKTYDQDEYIGLNQDILKTSWRRLLKTYEYSEYVRLDQDVLKTSCRRLLKTKDVFKTSSSRWMFAGNASKIFRIEFISKWPISNLSGYLDLIFWSPTLALVKLILFEQLDLSLDSLLHKTLHLLKHYWDSLLLSKTLYLSKTQTESGDSVALIKKWLLSKDFTNFFMIILLPEFFKCKPSFPNFFRCDVVIINKVKTRCLTLFCRALFT